MQGGKLSKSESFENLKLKHKYIFAQDAFGAGYWISDYQISLIHYYSLVLLSLYQTLCEALLKLHLLFLIHIRVLDW